MKIYRITNVSEKIFIARDKNLFVRRRDWKSTKDKFKEKGRKVLKL